MNDWHHDGGTEAPRLGSSRGFRLIGGDYPGPGVQMSLGLVETQTREERGDCHHTGLTEGLYPVT